MLIFTQRMGLGSSDYLTGSPVKSSGRRRGPSLPSPVKFQVVETNDDETDETGSVPAFSSAFLGGVEKS